MFNIELNEFMKELPSKVVIQVSCLLNHTLSKKHARIVFNFPHASSTIL